MSSISRPRVYILNESYHTKLYIFHKIIVKISQVCLFSRWYFRGDFFLKIGIQRVKVYTKNVPNIEVCDFIPGPSRPLPFKQVIVVLFVLDVNLNRNFAFEQNLLESNLGLDWFCELEKENIINTRIFTKKAFISIYEWIFFIYGV